MGYNSVILIVDDEPAGRETLDALLFMEGYELAFANNGAEALMKAAYLVPDLILLDIMMPGMDGFEVCRRLRSDALLAEVPVVIVTALDDRESRLRGLEMGADDFLTKPYDRAELRARVRTITRLNRYRRLLSERSKFEWMVDHADDGFVMVGDEDELRYANARARIYLGLPVDQAEPLAGAFMEAARQQYGCEPWEAWASWPRSDAGPRYLVRPETATDATLWLQVDRIEMTSLSDERYLIRLRDVTQSVIDRSVRWTFHSFVNHKLRTPLAQLTGFLDILATCNGSLSEAEKKRVLATVRHSARSLQDRLLSIFDYIDPAKPVEAAQPHCHLSQIGPMVADLAASLDLKPCPVTYDGIVDPEEVSLPLSRHTVDMILQELIENAQKFHPDRSPQLEIALYSQLNQVRIRIQDDGRPLSPDQLLRIWQPYYQAEKCFTGEVVGMGLGLSSVAEQIWSVGGSCRAYNRRDGRGLVIELTTPWATQPSPAYA